MFDPLRFKVCSLYRLPKPVAYIKETPGDGIVKCIVFPTNLETRVLLQKYIDDIAFTYHVVHLPSLVENIDSLYAQIDSETVQPGRAMLLLAIIASVTSQWTAEDAASKGLFDCPNSAGQQTASWIKASLDVLGHSRRSSTLCVDHVQALVIVSCVICHLEGFSSKFRSMLSTAVDVARQLGLHMVDHRVGQAMTAAQAKLGTVESEIRRRVWWFLTSTEW